MRDQEAEKMRRQAKREGRTFVEIDAEAIVNAVGDTLPHFPAPVAKLVVIRLAEIINEMNGLFAARLRAMPAGTLTVEVAAQVAAIAFQARVHTTQVPPEVTKDAHVIADYCYALGFATRK